MRISMRSGSQTKPGTILITQSLLHRHRFVYCLYILFASLLNSSLLPSWQVCLWWTKEAEAYSAYGKKWVWTVGSDNLGRCADSSCGSSTWFMMILPSLIVYDNWQLVVSTYCRLTSALSISSVLFDSCKELKDMMLLLLSEAWWMQKLSFPWKTCWIV